MVERIEIDTDHFKGNAPGKLYVRVRDSTRADPSEFNPPAERWNELLAESAVHPHTRHIFDHVAPNAATHVRLNIYPDGGVARLRPDWTQRLTR